MVGLFSAGLVVLSFLVGQKVRRIRFINMLGAIGFLIYGILLDVNFPIIIPNAFIICIQFYYLFIKKDKSLASNSSDNNFYQTIEKESVAEFKDRGSRFLAYAFPISSADDFKKRLKELKEEHPKAVHHCFAYRIGTDGNNFRSSDDGEPSGSAGRPILGQIDSKELINTAIIVVRYFGGTLLGVPGFDQCL